MTIPSSRQLRRSPSGPIVFPDVFTSEVENLSNVPGTTLEDALNVIRAKRVEYLDLLDNPIALWNFNDTLDAVLGPSFSLDTGIYRFTDVFPGVRGIGLDIGVRLSAPLTPSLQLLGDMSVEMLIQLDTNPGNTWICGVGGADTGAAANNVSWAMILNNATAPRAMRGFWESGSGVDRGFTTSTANGALSIPPLHNIMSIGFSRSGINGIPYFNGRPFGASISGVALPTGGTSGVMTLGARAGATNPDRVLVMSIAVYNRVRGASEWLASYNRSIGAGLGQL